MLADSAKKEKKHQEYVWALKETPKSCKTDSGPAKIITTGLETIFQGLTKALEQKNKMFQKFVEIRRLITR